MPKRNAFYAQSGGVTAVINASACGVIETARKRKTQIGKVYAGRNGIIGALTEDLIDTGKESAAAIAALRHTPAGAFGSCRYKLKGLEESRPQYQRLIEVFRAHDIGYFFYNGGGDSADTCLKISKLSQTMGYPIQAIHVPKTVDNDLPITDCCPGFGSVAKYIA
ncbi:MAG TPA: diphosphate--fructose-6-phosphate 1-phosphotransferase, partial [Burkholderiales bacterium]|nr:diphosphate--fructose-6-phosphate 1-phosphotransferase [Burkholderiales bacterium]